MISDMELVMRIALAVLLGGVIGFERELRHKTAGFRTNILICMGSALLTIVSIKITHDYTSTVADPGRIAAQIVTGIGFLGAGAIMRSRGSVIGLTTAASIWVTAAVGIAVGTGYYFAAGAVAVFTVLILQALVPFELSLRKKHDSVSYYLKYALNPEIDEIIKQFYQGAFIQLEELHFDIVDGNTHVRMSLKRTKKAHREFQDSLNSIDPDILCVHF